MSLDVIIAGASGAGLKVVQILEDQVDRGYTELRLVGFVDDNQDIWGTEYFGYPVFGSPSELSKMGDGKRLGVICPIGDPVNRYKMIERVKAYNVEFPCAIHPSAQVSAKARLGHGNILSQNVVIQAGVTIGDFNTFNISAVMGPMSAIHDFCTVNAHTMIASETVVNSYVYIGMGAKVIQRLEIATGLTIGANAVVNKKTNEWCTVVGVPAKQIKQRSNPFE